MTDIRLTLTLSALLAIFLYGCSSSPEILSDTLELRGIKNDFVNTHKRRARKYEADGALNQARREWQLIDAVQGMRNSTARVEIARLDREIELRFRSHLDAAHKAERRADYNTAQLALLKALALKPDNAEAIDKLKELVNRRSYAGLALEPRVSDIVEREVDAYTAPIVSSTNDKDNPGAGKGPSPQPMPGNEPATRGLRKIETKKGENSFQQGMAHLSRKEYEHALRHFLIARKNGERPREVVDRYVTVARQALANHHYNQGVIAFRAALYDRAVSEFEQALEYAPNHQKARFYRSSAKALQNPTE